MTHTLWMLALLLRIQACMLRRPDPIMRLCPQWIDRLIDIRRSSSWLLPWIRTYSFSQVVGKTKLFVVRLVTKPLRLRKHRHWLDSTIKLHFMNEDVRRHLVTLIDEHVRPIPPLSAALSELASHACPSSPMHAKLPPIWHQLSLLVPAEPAAQDTETSGAAHVLLQSLDVKALDHDEKEHILQLVIDTLDPHDLRFDADTASAVLVDVLGFDMIELVAMLVANPQATAFQLRRAQALRAQGVGSAKDPLVLAPSSTNEEKYPNVYGATEHGSVLSVYGTRFSLPEGTQRVHESYFEEVTIPRSKPLPFRSHERLILKDEMDLLCRGAFKQYNSLNRLQSAVYPMAYKTSENLLVCAPTGAGKTDVAMLSILQCVGRFSKYGANESIHVDANAFKIVYVAPMKALVSEIVSKFQKRLSYLGLKVRELTGDMQLTRKEIAETQMIVTTPEKWDVVTRKPMGDGDLALSVRLLIIDEVHLLHEERGAVIETIVARTQRLVEASQTMIRIVGLSATLPNFVDVADFLSVNRYRGLFYFGSAFRPVPLEQHFVGVRGKHGSSQSRSNLDRVTYEKVLELVQGGHPVMVFVHTRKDTVKTAQMLLELGKEDDLHSILVEGRDATRFERDVTSSRNRELRELFEHGIGIHNAGMLRSDRDLSERLFASGATRVLCCTATLAWGVNLPAYAVVIKGTDIYDAEQGKMVDLGILDVLQIFGRAGRPQYEDMGVSYICTSGEKLPHYIESITSAHPIESTFLRGIVDALNAEVALGSVTSLDDGISWLGFTYLFTRLCKAPRVYGLDAHDFEADPTLTQRRRQWITYAANILAQHQMIEFDLAAGTLRPTNMGRIASRYYLSHKTVGIFHERLRNNLVEADALSLMSRAADFDQIPLRESEEEELTSLLESVPCEVDGGTATAPGKVNILLQAHISYLYVDDFALVSDMRYVAQNAGRVLLSLFELALDKGFAMSASAFLQLAKAVDKRIWPYEHPLKQYPTFTPDMTHRISTWADELEVSQIRSLSIPALAQLLHTNERTATVAHNAAERFPALHARITARPTPDGYVCVDMYLKSRFVWDERIHGTSLPIVWWLEDDAQHVVFSDRLTLRNSPPTLVYDGDVYDHHLRVYVPLSPPDLRPTSEARCHFVWSSLHWLQAEGTVDVELDHLTCPTPTPSTSLLPLPLLPISENAMSDVLGISTLNAIQTQVYHTLAHSRANTLVCAPYASGKWTVVLFALARAWKEDNGAVLVIEPDEARMKERVRLLDMLAPLLGGQVVPPSPTWAFHQRAITVMTPDMAARTLASVTQTHLSLVIFLHVHKLSPMYEHAVMHVHRLRPARSIATSLSTSTAASLGAWLQIPTHAMYAFAPHDSPYPVSVSFDTVDIPYSDTLVRAYAKPAFDRIETQDDVALLFVPTRSQCMTAAHELAARFAMKGYTAHPDADEAAQSIEHQGLAHLVRQGLAVWHANLSRRDQRTVERLAEMQCLRAVLCAHDVAGHVPIRAPIVLVLGTQYTAHTSRHVQDYTMEQLWSMQRHAVRPNASSGEFVVLCQQRIRPVMERLLQTPVAIESSLGDAAPTLEALAQELVARRVHTRFDTVAWLATSYLAVRVRANPAWYADPGENERADPSAYLSELCDALVRSGEQLGLWCVVSINTVQPTQLAHNIPPGGVEKLCALQESVLHWQTVPHQVHRLLQNDETVEEEGLQAQCASLMLKVVQADKVPSLHRIVLAHWLTPLVSARTLAEMDDVLVKTIGGEAAGRVKASRQALLQRIMQDPNTQP